MSRCYRCGKECSLPFTCQHCGGKFCPDCRLPPSHDCAGIGSWNRKPAPSVGIRYGKSGEVSVTGAGYLPDSHRGTKKKPSTGIPYLWIIAVVIVLIVLSLAWLILNGFHAG